MTAALAVSIAATFVWLGIVLAICFVETPLKFRAPGVTVPIGLGIGRLVFRALNIAEAVPAVISGPSPVRVAVTAFTAVAASWSPRSCAVGTTAAPVGRRAQVGTRPRTRPGRGHAAARSPTSDPSRQSPTTWTWTNSTSPTAP